MQRIVRALGIIVPKRTIRRSKMAVVNGARAPPQDWKSL
jgi:hypothetical protein